MIEFITFILGWFILFAAIASLWLLLSSVGLERRLARRRERRRRIYRAWDRLLGNYYVANLNPPRPHCGYPVLDARRRDAYYDDPGNSTDAQVSGHQNWH